MTLQYFADLDDFINNNHDELIQKYQEEKSIVLGDEDILSTGQKENFLYWAEIKQIDIIGEDL